MQCSICRKSGHNRRTCIIHTNTTLLYHSKDAHAKRNGAKCLHSGISYEQKILTKLCRLSYSDIPIQSIDKNGGSTKNPDLQLNIHNKKINIEVKNKGGFEGGGISMKIIDNHLRCPQGTLHNDLLKGRTLWSGNIPSFMKGDKSLDTWKRERPMFRDEYYRISSDVIRTYYKNKGVDYVQIENKGLYHTGDDILCLGVPLFECKARIRIRCKQHGSTSMPSSVQAVFTFNRRSLEMSNYDIDNKLPSIFRSNGIL